MLTVARLAAGLRLRLVSPAPIGPLLLTLTLFVLAAPLCAAATTYYVSPSGNDNNAGTQAAPFLTIKQAITNNAVSGDTVTLEDGTYTGPGDVDLDFSGKSITVNSVNGAATTIIDCGGTTLTPHRAFYFHTNEANAIISGLTIKNGNESQPTNQNNNGGAIYIESGCTVTLIDCTLTGNTTTCGGYGFVGGGGVYNSGMVALRGCTIKGNTAAGGVDEGYGGGVDNDGGTVTLTDCTFNGNTATGVGKRIGNGLGGGLYNNDGTVMLTNCSFSGNTAGDGGGVFNLSGAATLAECTLTNNTSTAGSGGGVYSSSQGTTMTGTATLTNCTLSGNTANTDGGGVYNTNGLTLTNCLLTGNTTSSGNGGGIANEQEYSNGPAPMALLQFCTLSINTATATGAQGGALENDGTAMLTDDILWDNTAGTANEIGTPTSGSTTNVTYCDIQGGYAGNINLDPRFANPANGDFHVSVGSPALLAGTPITGVTTDLVGKTRNASHPTLGAYEVAAPAVTTITLASSHPTSLYGQSVTFTATVMGSSPTGNVTFTDTTTGASLGMASLSGGTAAVMTSSLTVGNHQIVAAYAGDVNNAASMSNPLTQTVTPTPAQLLWNKTDGTAALWRVNADGTFSSVTYGPFPGWTARAVAEAPNGTTDLLWTNTNGQASLWNVTALTASGYTARQYGPYTGYTAVSLSVGADGSPHLLWDKTDGTALLWTVNPSNGGFTYTSFGPFSGWTAKAVASGATVTDLLWTNVNGTADGYRIAANGSLTQHTFGPYANYTATSLSVGPDDGAHLLWDKTDGTALLWNADFSSGRFTYTPYGPFSGYAARAIATGPDNVTHILWDTNNGTASLWNVTGSGYTYHAFGPFAGWTAVAVSAGP